jgi:hypothetical protein
LPFASSKEAVFTVPAMLSAGSKNTSTATGDDRTGALRREDLCSSSDNQLQGGKRTATGGGGGGEKQDESRDGADDAELASMMRARSRSAASAAAGTPGAGRGDDEMDAGGDEEAGSPVRRVSIRSDSKRFVEQLAGHYIQLNEWLRQRNTRLEQLVAYLPPELARELMEEEPPFSQDVIREYAAAAGALAGGAGGTTRRQSATPAESVTPAGMQTPGQASATSRRPSSTARLGMEHGSENGSTENLAVPGSAHGSQRMAVGSPFAYETPSRRGSQRVAGGGGAASAAAAFIASSGGVGSTSTTPMAAGIHGHPTPTPAASPWGVMGPATTTTTPGGVNEGAVSISTPAAGLGGGSSVGSVTPAADAHLDEAFIAQIGFQLLAQNEALQETVERQRVEAESLQQELAELTSRLAVAEDRAAARETQNEHLRQEVWNLQSESQTLKRVEIEHVAKLARIQQELETAQEEIFSLREQADLDAEERFRLEDAQADAKIDQDKKISALERQLHLVRADRDLLDRRVETLEEEAGELRARLAAWRNDSDAEDDDEENEQEAERKPRADSSSADEPDEVRGGVAGMIAPPRPLSARVGTWTGSLSADPSLGNVDSSSSQLLSSSLPQSAAAAGLFYWDPAVGGSSGALSPIVRGTPRTPRTQGRRELKSLVNKLQTDLARSRTELADLDREKESVSRSNTEMQRMLKESFTAIETLKSTILHLEAGDSVLRAQSLRDLLSDTDIRQEWKSAHSLLPGGTGAAAGANASPAAAASLLAKSMPSLMQQQSSAVALVALLDAQEQSEKIAKALNLPQPPASNDDSPAAKRIPASHSSSDPPTLRSIRVASSGSLSGVSSGTSTGEMMVGPAPRPRTRPPRARPVSLADEVRFFFF